MPSGPQSMATGSLQSAGHLHPFATSRRCPVYSQGHVHRHAAHLQALRVQPDWPAPRRRPRVLLQLPRWAGVLGFHANPSLQPGALRRVRQSSAAPPLAALHCAALAACPMRPGRPAPPHARSTPHDCCNAGQLFSDDDLFIMDSGLVVLQVRNCVELPLVIALATGLAGVQLPRSGPAGACRRAPLLPRPADRLAFSWSPRTWQGLGRGASTWHTAGCLA